MRYQVDPDRCDDALAALEDAAQQIGAIDGNSGGYVLVDGEAGRIMTFIMWQDQAAMEASEVHASRLRQDAIRAVEGEIVSIERLRIATEIADEP